MEKKNYKTRSIGVAHKSKSLGIILILVGVVFLLFNMDVFPAVWKDIIISWQSLLILFGVISFFHKNYISSLILLFVGAYFIFPNVAVTIGFNYSSEMMNKIIWPVLIIAIGLLIVLRKNHDSATTYKCCETSDKNTEKEGMIKYDLFMKGVDEIYLEQEFRGGEIEAAMSGVKLDLRKTSLQEGISVLKIDSFMSGLTLLIPEDWPVEIQNSSFLGEFSDKRPSNGNYVDRKLIIKADFFMGGGSIEC